MQARARGEEGQLELSCPDDRRARALEPLLEADGGERAGNASPPGSDEARKRVTLRRSCVQSGRLVGNSNG